MNELAIDLLASIAAETAMRSAAMTVRKAGLSNQTNIDRLRELIREELQSRLDKAIDDAKIAFDAGIAGATFRASMSLAGIQAANRYLAEI